MNALERETLTWLKRHLPTVTPSARDAYVFGDATMLRAELAVRGVLVPDIGSLLAARDDLSEWQEQAALSATAPDGEYRFAILAAAAEYPAATVRLIRPAEGNPGRFVVLADCPYADEHDYKGRGHAQHGYWFRAYPVPDRDGVIGVRHAQCDLGRINLVVPATWVPYSWEDPRS